MRKSRALFVILIILFSFALTAFAEGEPAAPPDPPTLSPSTEISAAEYGKGATLGVSVGGADGCDLSYAWYMSRTEGELGERIPWALGSKYTLPADSEPGDYYLTCSVLAIRTEDGVAAPEASISFKLAVVDAIVEMPSADTRVFAYTGRAQEYFIEESALYSVDGNIAIDAGEHTVTISLADPDRYCWSDGTRGELEYSFVIERAETVITQERDRIELTLGEAVVYPQISASFGDLALDILPEDISAVGVYTVTYTVAETENYTAAVATLTVVVNPAPEPEPIEPETPTEPDTPAEPDTPSEPEPEAPTEPETPTEPEAPTEPETPIDPGEPTIPDGGATEEDPAGPADGSEQNGEDAKDERRKMYRRISIIVASVFMTFVVLALITGIRGRVPALRRRTVKLSERLLELDEKLGKK